MKLLLIALVLSGGGRRCVVSCYHDPPECLYEIRDAGTCAPCPDGGACRPIVVNLGTWDPVIWK